MSPTEIRAETKADTRTGATASSTVQQGRGAPLREIRSLEMEKSVGAAAFNADESILAIAEKSGENHWQVVLVDRPSMGRLGFIQARVGENPRLVFSPVAELLAVAGSKAIQLWEIPISPLTSDRPLARKYLRWEIGLEEKGKVGKIAFGTSPNTVIWEREGALYRREVSAGSPPAESPFWQPESGEGRIGSFALAPGKNRLAIIFREKKEVGLLEMKSGTSGQPLLRRLRGHRFPAVAAAYPLGRRALTLDAGKYLLRWGEDGNATSTVFLGKLPESFHPAVMVPVGAESLAILGREGEGSRARVIETATGTPLGDLREVGISQFAVSPTGRYMASWQGRRLRLYEFSISTHPLEYVRFLRGLKAFTTAQSYVRLMDDEDISPRLKADLLNEAGRDPPGERLRLALTRLREARTTEDPDRIGEWAEKVLALHPDHPEALAALRRRTELRESNVLRQARESFDLGQNKIAISLLSSRIGEDSALYPAAMDLIRKAEAKRSLQTLLMQAKEKLNLGDTLAAGALVAEALRQEAGNPAALALREEIDNREGKTWTALLAALFSIAAALAVVAFLVMRFRGRFSPYLRNLRLEPDKDPVAGRYRKSRKNRPESTRVQAPRGQPAKPGKAGSRREQPSRGTTPRKLVVEALLGDIEEKIRLARHGDVQKRHTALMMELEAELHSIQRRMADPLTELGPIHNRLKAIRSQMGKLKFDPSEEVKPVFSDLSHYDLLKLKPSATTEEIKAAYHRLVKQYHPDVHNASEFDWIKSESERMSRRLGEAYQVLNDEEARARYDQELNKGRTVGKGRGLAT